ncbi:MAG: MFS transporter [Anaerolineae bacterium]
MVYWKRNLVVLCAAQFLSFVGFMAYLPFIPYYVQELGVVGLAAAMSFVAVFDSGSAVAMMVAAPIWGGLSDRFGRKMMLVRATFAGAVIAFLMGLVINPGQLLVLRLMQGVLCGTVAAAMTLVATETPDENLGSSLGLMQTAQFVGQAVGPLLGGLAADAFGFRAVFAISATLLSVSGFGVVFLVRERAGVLRKRSQQNLGRVSLRARMGALGTRNALVLVLALASTSFALSVLSPILALYIETLTAETSRLGTLAGGVIAASAVTSALAAFFVGRLGDRFGQKRALLACMVGMALIYIPQALARNATDLMLLRGVQGLFMGGIMPTANALLAQSTDADRRGAVFGAAAGAQAGGRAVGPIVGAAVANLAGMRSTFWVTAGIFGMLSVLVGTMVQGVKPAAVQAGRAIPGTAAKGAADS